MKPPQSGSTVGHEGGSKLAAPLTEAFVRKVSKPGKYGDQHGLLLRVRSRMSKQWIWRGTVRGKRMDLGLGGHWYISLAEARRKAFQFRKLARAGQDPRTLRDGVPTFETAAALVIAIRSDSWQPGSKTEAQWRTTLRKYAMPKLGERSIDAITATDVFAVLRPIWTTKPGIAHRVRWRIHAVMQWAMAQGYRSDNPAAEAIEVALSKIPEPRERAQRSSSPLTEHELVQLAHGILRKQGQGICDEEYVLDVLTMMLGLTCTEEDERVKEDAVALLAYPEQWATVIQAGEWKTCLTTFRTLEALLDLAQRIDSGEDTIPRMRGPEPFDVAYPALKDWAVISRNFRRRLDGRRRTRAHTHGLRDRAIVTAMSRIWKIRKQKGIRFHMTSREGATGTSLTHEVAGHLSSGYSTVHKIWCNREHDPQSEEMDESWRRMEVYVLAAAFVAPTLAKAGMPFDMSAFRWYSTHTSPLGQRRRIRPTGDLPG